MGKYVGGLLITIGVLLLLLGTLLSIGDYSGELETAKNLIGEKVSVESDTLTIVNYSMWHDDYTLSNGLTVAEDYVMKYIVEE